jgi:hypothetical protein
MVTGLLRPGLDVKGRMYSRWAQRTPRQGHGTRATSEGSPGSITVREGGVQHALL